MCKALLLKFNDRDEVSQTPPCFIIDDSDLEKRGRKIVFIGRIWSHVFNKSILRFKSLNLCYWSGNSLLALDFSMHQEMGKNKSKPQGMSVRSRKERFSKQRSPSSHGYKRIEELVQSKIEMAIKMIKIARSKGIEARYVLMDSWFCYEKIIRYCCSIVGMDLICRAKMGSTKYLYKSKELSAKAIIPNINITRTSENTSKIKNELYTLEGSL